MMCSRNLVSGIVAWCSFVLACHSASADSLLPVDRDFFESQVRPLLLQHCAECHSRKAGDPEGGLSFDSRADFLAAAGVAVAGGGGGEGRGGQREEGQQREAGLTGYVRHK